MDEYMQFSAKTKNEAITKACIELGVSSDQLEIQVISELRIFRNRKQTGNYQSS